MPHQSRGEVVVPWRTYPCGTVHHVQPLCPVCANSRISSGVEEGTLAMGGKGGRREVGTSGVAPSTGTFVGVLPSDAVARLRLWSVPLDGVPGVVLALLDAALNACKICLWLELGGFNELVVSKGVLFLVGVVSWDHGVLFRLFNGPPLPLPFPFPAELPPVIALRGSGAAKEKTASAGGVGLVIEAGPVGCSVSLSDISKNHRKIGCKN